MLFSAYQLARSESDGAAILLASTGKDVNLTARSASWNVAKDVAALDRVEGGGCDGALYNLVAL